MEQLVELSDGTRLWTHVSGKGAPAVFLNGGPGMADYLAPVSALFESSARVYRFEQRGCGRSDAGGPYTLKRSVADIEELRKYWRVDRWYIVGHSWGVDLGLAYALGHAESVLGLVGLAGGRIHDDRSWKRIYDERKHEEEQPTAAAGPNLQVNRALNADWKRYCKEPALLRSLATLEVPALFLYGENDIRPSWPTEQLCQLMPTARFPRIADADHHLWQGNSDALRRQVIEFLSEHGAGT